MSPRDVAGRAIALGLFGFRGRFETVLAETQGDLTEALQMIVGAMDWAEESGAKAFCTPTEAQLFGLPASSWMDPTLRNLSRWHEESLGSLLWALELVDAKGYDELFDGEALFRTLPFLSDSPFVTRDDMAPREEVEAMLGAVSLRSAAAIETERQLAEIWLWRARTKQLMDEGRNLGAVLEEVAEKAGATDRIATQDGDFVAFGKPYKQLSPQEYVVASSIATARLRALNWVCRHSEDWDDVPLTT